MVGFVKMKQPHEPLEWKTSKPNKNTLLSRIHFSFPYCLSCGCAKSCSVTHTCPLGKGVPEFMVCDSHVPACSSRAAISTAVTSALLHWSQPVVQQRDLLSPAFLGFMGYLVPVDGLKELGRDISYCRKRYKAKFALQLGIPEEFQKFTRSPSDCTHSF